MAIPKWLSFGRVLLTLIAIAAGVAIWQLPVLDSGGRSMANVLAVLELAILATGLYSLQLLAEQNRQAAKWNKLLSYHQFFGDLITTEMVKKVQVVATAHGFDSSMNSLQAMSSASVNGLVGDADSLKDVQAYLDEFEEFCGAVHAGVTDTEYAYTLEATRVIRAWIVFEPYIRTQRASHPYSRCYLELERLGVAWKARREREAREKNDQDGVKPSV